MMSVCSQDQIVPPPALGKIYLGVINDMVCANRSRRVDIPRATHGGNFSPERFGNLHRKCTHTARRAFNKNLLTWLDPSLVPKTLQRRACRDWHGCRLLKREIGWLRPQLVFNRTYILSKPPSFETRYPEHLVAWLKLLYVSANRFHSPGDITTEDLVFWRTQSRDHAVPRRTFH